MKRLFTVMLINAVFVQVTACESPEPGERNVRDSAGVQIVESDVISNVQLQVAPEPLLEVGTAEGEAAFLFMRPVDADEEQIELGLAPLRERIRDLPDDQRAEAERQLRDRADAMRTRLSRYSTMPAYRNLDVDAKGRLWVRTGAFPVYDILDTKGRFLGSVELAGEPLEFGADEVIIRREDELGVPSVAVLELLESSNN